ncbi:hypothetical protein R1flu_021582 [Riccia fluitans]|uniref:Uncharacterized protein n=1 Tax=Riccia fluitans TaxID=41844 RepID=A0ABD1ZSR2_9MARC
MKRAASWGGFGDSVSVENLVCCCARISHPNSKEFGGWCQLSKQSIPFRLDESRRIDRRYPNHSCNCWSIHQR